MSTLLVVDDSEIDRRLVTGLLRDNADWRLETAANGVEALERLAEARVDLVITDLQMPELDGLELVRQIGARFPRVPVILMTAHGSESLAIEALEAGASSYVPKANLGDMLADTVTQVLSLAGSNREYERLVACQTLAHFRFKLENDPALIDPLVDLIQQITFGFELCNSNGRFGIGMALQQAILNAMYHGNLELSKEDVEAAREHVLAEPAGDIIAQRKSARPYCDRRILIDARITPDELEVTIADEGPGFDVASTQAALNGGPTELRERRGLQLMKILMDEVRFNPTGNEVTLVKRREGSNGRRPQEEPVAAGHG
jgi:CheY-like chemotaxis protein